MNDQQQCQLSNCFRCSTLHIVVVAASTIQSTGGAGAGGGSAPINLPLFTENALCSCSRKAHMYSDGDGITTATATPAATAATAAIASCVIREFGNELIHSFIIIITYRHFFMSSVARSTDSEEIY